MRGAARAAVPRGATRGLPRLTHARRGLGTPRRAELGACVLGNARLDSWHGARQPRLGSSCWRLNRLSLTPRKKHPPPRARCLAGVGQAGAAVCHRLHGVRAVQTRSGVVRRRPPALLARSAGGGAGAWPRPVLACSHATSQPRPRLHADIGIKLVCSDISHPPCVRVCAGAGKPCRPGPARRLARPQKHTTAASGNCHVEPVRLGRNRNAPPTSHSCSRWRAAACSRGKGWGGRSDAPAQLSWGQGPTARKQKLRQTLPASAHQTVLERVPVSLRRCRGICCCGRSAGFW